jgi:ribosome-interacting GTPase 1
VSEEYVPPADEAVRMFRKKTILAANKADADPDGENLEGLKFFFGAALPVVPVSAAEGTGLEDLRTRIFKILRVIRVYSKAPGKKADHDSPFILKSGSTVLDIASAVHKDFAEKLNYARLWRGREISGLMVNRDFALEDEDIVELHL